MTLRVTSLFQLLNLYQRQTQLIFASTLSVFRRELTVLREIIPASSRHATHTPSFSPKDGARTPEPSNQQSDSLNITTRRPSNRNETYISGPERGAEGPAPIESPI
ncbi:uncharacterized protein MCYG_03417 [Microsporum canis CBS 113480]|uniref:Uncharacterized protein n=1 Tax=Arthroderma otae (strain ATCC MYA-4605 / CBS 113480) TaxID=554155 RepID=C5FLM6_ARTOC|nr:uncharacterized protein MCYG_03417 [Microsporum canis CBS 113480]EEQ30598.1 predicted protein [Microsporum canis CBS 113480]